MLIIYSHRATTVGVTEATEIEQLTDGVHAPLDIEAQDHLAVMVR
jgi:hypothetical protein